MKISLIIPVYNEETTILEVIEKSRSYVDEILVINDCSTDNTHNILKTIKDITVINNQKNLGYSKNIDKGIKLAKNNLVITMDSDLEHNPLQIQEFIGLYKKEKPPIIIGKRDYLPRRCERAINSYFEEFYGLSDILCGFKLIDLNQVSNKFIFSTNDDYGLTFILDNLLLDKKIVNLRLENKECRTITRLGNNLEFDNKIFLKFVDVIRYFFKNI